VSYEHLRWLVCLREEVSLCRRHGHRLLTGAILRAGTADKISFSPSHGSRETEKQNSLHLTDIEWDNLSLMVSNAKVKQRAEQFSQAHLDRLGRC
jgi:hypothetical protein